MHVPSQGPRASSSSHLHPAYAARAVCLLAALLAVGCATEEEQEVVLRFAAQVGEVPFACGQTYAGVGLSGSTLEALDFRMYVHDVALLTADGATVPLALEQDGLWQRDEVALLDFEDGSGSCGVGNPELRNEILGTIPEDDYIGLEFKLGLPSDLNHLDAATAPAPLNVPGMWWSWSGGYKYVRLDVKTPQTPAFYFHLGATSCEGSPSSGFACAHGNTATMTLPVFDAAVDTVVIDVAQLFSGSNLDAALEGDAVPGCMAFSGDPECPPMFERLGMTFEGVGVAAPQVVFRRQ